MSAKKVPAPELPVHRYKPNFSCSEVGGYDCACGIGFRTFEEFKAHVDRERFR